MIKTFITLVFTTVMLAGGAGVSVAQVNRVANFHQFDPHVLTSGQPTDAELKQLHADNVEVVINLVPETEAIFNPREAVTVRKQGIVYIHIPVSWESPTFAQLDEFLHTMRNNMDRKVLVHCWSNARASAFVYAHRVSLKPDSAFNEWEELKRVWTEVAGFSLDNSSVWKTFLRSNVGVVD